MKKLIDKVDFNALSPMMKLYTQTKKQYEDCILFYRLGDFYEMFFDDAIVVSKELELTLTGKECGLSERAPMCGVPYHAVDTYLNRLVGNGHKVAICEQVEDPKLAKGLVKREVTRIVTPGTILDTSSLDGKRNNYLMCIVCIDDKFGLAAVDISTGIFYVTEVDSRRGLRDEVTKYQPSEIICSLSLTCCGIDLDEFHNLFGTTLFTLDMSCFSSDKCEDCLLNHFHSKSLKSLGLGNMSCGAVAAGAVLGYLKQTQKCDLKNLTVITPYTSGSSMVLDTFTRRNLELTETLREKKRKGSLLYVLDKTKTAMGSRMLRSFIEQPLIDGEQIEGRLQAVAELVRNAIVREEIREYLQRIYDLERLCAKVSYSTANPRDIIALNASIEKLPSIKAVLSQVSSPMLLAVRDDIDELEDIHRLISSSIIDDPPITVREAGLIRDGFNRDVDALREVKSNGKGYLADVEANERQRTGIVKMKLKFNKVFGYYLEVPNSYRDKVPQDYMRKQTLVGAERYITPDLKKLEEKILGASDKLNTLEYDIFCSIRSKIADNTSRIQKSARAIAMIDAIASLAYVAEHNRYVRPKVNDRGVIDIKDGRHPVIEQMEIGELFVPNDTHLDGHDNRVNIITGPNMAGKSTYLRQSALIVLMTQIGSFVPASSADICLVDRVFTRVGASDDLASGRSTFMVEMSEVADILRHATGSSLLILDEIGRGTSTYDGLSIAWAVVEYIANKNLLGSKTLFATHYHELTELEGRISGVNNYCIAVREKGDDIVFLRKIIRGGADKSYGIQVARLAGVPDIVIERAKEISKQLTESDIAGRKAASFKNERNADSFESIQRIDAGDGKDRAGRTVAKIGKDQAGRTDAGDGKDRAGRTVAGDRKDQTDNTNSVDLEMRQLSLFDMVANENIIRELMSIDVLHLTPVEALNSLYALQNKYECWRAKDPGRKNYGKNTNP